MKTSFIRKSGNQEWLRRMGRMGLVLACLAMAPWMPVCNGQTNAPSALALIPMPTAGTAQAAGQAVLDGVPGLNILTNIPSTTFDKAGFEVFAGLENSGSSLQNVLDGQFDFKTNFFARAELGLGATPTVLNKIGLGGGLRKAWTLWEIYGGLLGVRNWQPNFDTWEGEAFAGIAWKPSSGLAVYGEIGTLISAETTAPSLTFKTGINFPVPGW